LLHRRLAVVLHVLVTRLLLLLLLLLRRLLVWKVQCRNLSALLVVRHRFRRLFEEIHGSASSLYIMV
jgi:hypothetical protein